MYMCIHMYKHICISLNACIHGYVHTYVYVCMDASLHRYVCSCMRADLYIWLYLDAYTNEGSDDNKVHKKARWPYVNEYGIMH